MNRFRAQFWLLTFLSLIFMQVNCSGAPATAMTSNQTNTENQPTTKNSDSNLKGPDDDSLDIPAEDAVDATTENSLDDGAEDTSDFSTADLPNTPVVDVPDPTVETPPDVEIVDAPTPTVETPPDVEIVDAPEPVVVLNLNSFDYANLEAVSPVGFDDFNIASAFGPRLQNGQGNRYDFHRGLDIPGDRDAPIFSIADGEIIKVYDVGSSAYPDSGRVVIIRHTVLQSFIFQGTEITQYDSMYFHLESFSDKAQEVLNTGTPQSILAGELVGGMGDSGITDMLHLHFEVRLQTTCSLEYQLTNPDRACAQYGFDPHINPLDLFIEAPVDNSVYGLRLLKEPTTLKIEATAERPYFNIDGIVVELYIYGTQTELVFEKTIFENARLGFDASSTENLDNPQLEFVTVQPHTLGLLSNSFQLDFIVDLKNFPTAHFAKVMLFNTQELVQEKTLEF